VYDTPGAIATQLTKWFGGNTSYTFAMNETLYYVYSIPNVILAFFGYVSVFFMTLYTHILEDTLLIKLQEFV
jgi:hypothetical protein